METLFFIVGILYIVISVILAIATAQSGVIALWNAFSGIMSGLLFLVVSSLISRVDFLQQKLNLYQVKAKKEDLPQNTCWRCGKKYDFDYPQCPHCKAPPVQAEE